MDNPAEAVRAAQAFSASRRLNFEDVMVSLADKVVEWNVPRVN
jgi:hypothetical protein